MSDLKSLIEHAAQFAAMVFRDKGSVAPMWICEQANGERFVVGSPWSSDNEKDLAVEALRVLFQQQQVVRYVNMVEAWTVERVGKVPPERPSLHPDRREIIAFMAESAEGESEMAVFYILRPEHGPATLSPLQWRGGMFAGRMANLLRPRTQH